MPRHEEAERGLLSCLLNDARLIATARAQLVPEVFYNVVNAAIYQIILDIDAGDRPADLVTISDEMIKQGVSEKLGGPGFLAELFSFVPTPVHFTHYRDILQAKYARRVVIQTAEGLIERARLFDQDQDWRDLCLEAQGALFTLTQNHGQTRQFVPAAQIMPEVAGYIQEAMENKGHVTHGLATGFTDFDRLTMGLKPGQLVIVAGRPAMGKSAFAANIVESIALASGHYSEFDQPRYSVGLVTLEMSGAEILTRMTMGRSSVNMLRVRDGFCGKDEARKIANITKELSGAPIDILDTGNLTIQELRPLCRQYVNQKKLSGTPVGCLVIDYLQLLKSGSKRARDNRYIEIQEISQGLKALAKELALPIIVCAQLGRKVEERKGCRPMMSDLRESGDIENDADIICLLYRRAYYMDCPKEENEADFATEAELIVDKHRGGPVGSIKLRWTGELARFDSLTSRLASNNPNERQGAPRHQEPPPSDDDDPFRQ
jgi:replicative DNA helicase